jgi:hypothetical protein
LGNTAGNMVGGMVSHTGERARPARAVPPAAVVIPALVALALLAVVIPAPARAATVRVPEDAPDIQAAVALAAAGDHVLVAPGRHCGATLDRPVHLRADAAGGQVVITGCATGPALFEGLRAGFLLPGSDGASPASGTSIEGFVFDGAGVAARDLTPLAFGVFARFAHDVSVTGNTFHGTVQAVTNTAGDGWLVSRNAVHDLRVLDCPVDQAGALGPCGGGGAIVVQAARGELAAPGGPEQPVNRPERNQILHNQVTGRVPDGFALFGMVGILLGASDATLVFNNRLAIQAAALPAGPDAAGWRSAGVVLTHGGGTAPPTLPGTRLSAVVMNDAEGSEVALVVDGQDGANTEGLYVAGNRGPLRIEAPAPGQ